MGIEFWAVATLAAVTVGLGKGGVPVVSALAVPLLSLVVSPVAAAGILLPVYLASDVFGLIAYRRFYDRQVLRMMMVVMPIGVGIGWLTVDIVSDAAVTLILGIIGGAFAVGYLMKRPVEGPPRAPKWGSAILWGTMSGFTSFVSHAGAPPYQIFALPLRQPKMVFAGTVTVAFAYINVVKLIPYYALGQLSVENLTISVGMMVPAILAVFLGFVLIRVVREALFFQIVTWTLLILSLRLIWDGASQLT